MKKTIFITVICTLAAVLLIGLVVWIIIGAMQPKPWNESLEGNVSFKGEIVEIVVKDEGKIITVVDAYGEQAKEFWVYEDTVLEGEVWGSSLDELLDKQIAGAYVSVNAYDIRDDILDGRKLYPAKKITIAEP